MLHTARIIIFTEVQNCWRRVHITLWLSLITCLCCYSLPWSLQYFCHSFCCIQITAKWKIKQLAKIFFSERVVSILIINWISFDMVSAIILVQRKETRYLTIQLSHHNCTKSLECSSRAKVRFTCSVVFDSTSMWFLPRTRHQER